MSLFTDNPRVVFSVTNSICYDQRVLKIAKTLENLGCDITIIGRITNNCSNTSEIPFRSVRFKMLFKRGFLFYACFNTRLFFYLLFHKYDVLEANDLDTLLPNFIISKIKRLPLIYDSHEFFTGLPELNGRPFVKWVWKSIEKTVFPKLKYVMTVSEPIASLYEEMYSVKPLVIRNISRKSDDIKPYSRKEIGISESDLLIIIQGSGINIDKGAEELIDAVSSIEGVALLVVGSGDVLPLLKQKVNEFNIGNKVKFINTVPWEILMRYTKAADIGMCLEKDTNLNYRYSLPNKLFDYISAGISVIASNLPETARILSEYGCGVIIKDVTSKSISDALSESIKNPDKLRELKKNANLASKKLTWENERKKLLKFYKEILSL